MEHDFINESSTAPEGDRDTYKAFGPSVAG